MDEQLNVAWPLARIMRKSKNGKNTYVGIQYQWSNGETQNRIDGKETHPASELIYVPIPCEDIHATKARPPLK